MTGICEGRGEILQTGDGGRTDRATARMRKIANIFMDYLYMIKHISLINRLIINEGNSDRNYVIISNIITSRIDDSKVDKHKLQLLVTIW